MVAVMGVVACSSVLVSMVAARPLAARAFMRWASAAAATAGVATVGVTAAAAGILGLEPNNELTLHSFKLNHGISCGIIPQHPGPASPRCHFPHHSFEGAVA